MRNPSDAKQKHKQATPACAGACPAQLCRVAGEWLCVDGWFEHVCAARLPVAQARAVDPRAERGLRLTVH